MDAEKAKKLFSSLLSLAKEQQEQIGELQDSLACVTLTLKALLAGFDSEYSPQRQRLAEEGGNAASQRLLALIQLAIDTNQEP